MNTSDLEITEMNAGNNNLSSNDQEQQQQIGANNFTNFVDIERNDLGIGITKPQQQQQNDFSNKQHIEVTPSPAIQVQEQAKVNDNDNTKPFSIQNQVHEAMDTSIASTHNNMQQQIDAAADVHVQKETIQIEIPEVSEPTTKKIKLAENEKQETPPHLLEANLKQGTSEIKSAAFEVKNDDSVDDKPPILTDESKKTTVRKEQAPPLTRKVSPRNQGNLKIDSICKELKQKKDAAAITKEKPKVEATPAQLVVEKPKAEKSTPKVPAKASSETETAAKVEKKVESSDDEIRKNLLAGSTKEFRHELELMKGELEKSEPDSKKIIQGIQATFKERQLKYSSDKITISETYVVCPALRRYDAIITECELVKDKPGNWTKFAITIEKMVLSDAEKELQKVKSLLADKRVHISAGLEKWNNIKKDGSDAEKLKFKKDFGLLCCLSRKCRKFWELNFFRERKPDEQLVIDIMSPFIDVEGDLFQDNTKFTLYVEGVKIMETSTLFDATLVAYCLYWTFNLEYRPEIKGLFTAFDLHF